jgi:hypothetical protein
MWEYAGNVYKTEDGKYRIHRYCEGETKTWNVVKVEIYEYEPVSNVAVILCRTGTFISIDIYRRMSQGWDVLHYRIASCDELRYTLPVIRRLLAREFFDKVEEVVNYLAERWIKEIRRWTQL